MTIAQAILLGALQGATEFLPVSSDGHLVLAEAILKLDANAGDLVVFNLLVHVATVAAIVVALREDLLNILTAALGRTIDVKSPKFGTEMRDIFYTTAQARAIVWWIAVCVFCTGILHIAIEKAVGEDNLDRFITNSTVAGFGFLATCGMLVMGQLVKPGEANIRQTGVRRAIAIGLSQWFAVLPGWSRSGTTIGVGIATGMARLDAAKFSFLMAIPLILLAFLKEAHDKRDQLHLSADAVPFAVGFVVAMGVGIWAIQFLMKLLRDRNGLWPFIYYTAAVGLVTLGLAFGKVI